MIVRIMGEGQARIAESHLAELNELDDRLMAEVRGGDEAGFRRTLTALLDRVRELGEPLPDDSLEPSELILPAGDATLEQVRELLSDEGLIPSSI
ncbi:PspA-associated protein PspAA [Streptomyces sp. DW26H14]|uniref:PspA-associated protein PspAA n=1 Tax=Streptomyces sp. DW26H14 TaxID=3435395 RepID=UPI00403D831A